MKQDLVKHNKHDIDTLKQTKKYMFNCYHECVKMRPCKDKIYDFYPDSSKLLVREITTLQPLYHIDLSPIITRSMDFLSIADDMILISHEKRFVLLKIE